MKLTLATAIALLATGSAMAADVYDAVFVTDAAACARATEDQVLQPLFDLGATMLVPRRGILSKGELICTTRGFDTDISPIGMTPDEVELYATARCHGFDVDFIDQIVISAFSQGINMQNGDDGIDHPAGEKVELYSMRDGARPEDSEPDYFDYATIFVRCDGLSPEDIKWPE